MREKLIQFISNLNGQFVEVSSKEAIYQCMDLSYVWAFVLDIPKATIQRGYAHEVYTQATDFTREYFEIIPNLVETIPQPGDLVVWKATSGNIAGHIAIVIEATQTKMKVFEQNNPVGTNAHIQERNYTNVIGFLRPKNVTVEGVPQWLVTLLQEINLNIKNEPEIRDIFEKARKYNDEVANLQEQVKSANEMLATKSIEVSELTTKNDNLNSRLDEKNNMYNIVLKERDETRWENDKLKIEIKNGLEKIEELQKEVDTHKSEITSLKTDLVKAQKASISDYSGWTLLFRGIAKLIGGGKK